jgi:hypothetical protein
MFLIKKDSTMLFKTIFLSFVMFLSLSAQAFNLDECKEIAENIYGAQTLLNQSPEVFDKATEMIKGQKAEDMDWSEAQKKKILEIAGALKQGDNPTKVGNQVFLACKNTV